MNFYYDSNACWGLVTSLEKLKQKCDLVLEENNGVKNVDEFLDKSKQHYAGVNSYGLRREHEGKTTLRMKLKKINKLDEFLKMYK